MQAGGALALAAIIIAASAGIVIRQRRGVGWRRIVVAALLVWLGVAGLVVLWALIAAVAGQRAYFGAVQLPLSAFADATVGIAFGAVAMHGYPRGSRRRRPWPASVVGLPWIGAALIGLGRDALVPQHAAPARGVPVPLLSVRVPGTQGFARLPGRAI